MDPELAARLADVDLSLFNPTLTRTRDERTSFRFTRPDGRPEWLGRTSVPGVRAAALLEQFDPGEANVLLPGFGEGTEVGTLLKTLEPHRVVFVWETDPVTVRLVLALHDYAADLAAERLVILQCPAEELARTLTDWLIRHPTRSCPGRLMVWPWQTRAELDECRSAVEAAWRH